MTVLVTGAQGFVGSVLCSSLARAGFSVRPLIRNEQHSMLLANLLPPAVVDLEAKTDWSIALKGITEVIHLAGRTHVMHGRSKDQLAAYRRINVVGTLNLARQAVKAGVRRFVFVSSIKVNGETTQPDMPFTADDIPSPLGPYGVTKHEAEQGLQEIAAQTGLEVVIIRPPLVYGPGVKANFGAMLRWVARGIPLPFGNIHNSRSMIALHNLVDLLVTCIKHPAAAGQIFLVSDGEDVSTTELLKRIAQVMGKKAILLPVPARVVQVGAITLGQRGLAQRLCGSLQLEISKTRYLLDWTPPLSLDQGLKETVRAMKVLPSV